MSNLILSGLYIYPIKSAAGIAVDAAQLTSRGLHLDRRYMVVSPDGQFMTQRRFPKMALIQVAIADTNSAQLRVTAPGMSDLVVEPPTDNRGNVEVEVWGDRTQSLLVSDAATTWFSHFLGVPCQLVYMPETATRPTAHGELGTDNLVSFADAYPYLLLSEASLSTLNQKLTEKGEPAVTMKRFRPNLVVSGVEEPHAEDTWSQIQIGEVVFDLPQLCARCSIPNVIPTTGDRSKEPTKTLATYRSWDRAIWFGQNCVAQGGIGKVMRVGDTVEISKQKVV